MDAVQKTVSQNASLLHANKVAAINASYGFNFQPMQFGAGNSQALQAVHLRARHTPRQVAIGRYTTPISGMTP
jgi:hypothetical protein